MTKSKLVIGPQNITLDDIYRAVITDCEIELSNDSDFRERLQLSRRLLEQRLENGDEVYGVTTGYGDSYHVKIPPKLQRALPLKIATYHRCGLGEDFSYTETRAIQLVRIVNLTRGYSAVSIDLLENMVTLYNHKVAPRIPKEGSVGASGDLTPLAYYAATLMGEGEVFYKNKLLPTAEVLKELNLTPIQLKEKEGLALMNGTAVMAAISCLAIQHAKNITHIAAKASSLNTLALLANPSHFDAEIFQAKPHPGSVMAAKLIRSGFSDNYLAKDRLRLQDRYSIRCSPHVIGVLADAISAFAPLVETEINSANDNPLIDPESEKVLHGGNFYGGHMAFVSDSLKTLVANIADLLDRQMALLVDTKFSNGLPANLSNGSGEDALLNHGLKALQISSSAWTAEALKNTMPASVFSRSTECHNQDKVSMGTIAARDCMRVIELTYQVVAANLIAGMQAFDLRKKSKELSTSDLSQDLIDFYKRIRAHSQMLTDDRALESDLRQIIKDLQGNLYL